MSSYQKIKEHIFRNLQKKDGALSSNEIGLEIKNTQDVIAAIGLENFASIISEPGLESLSDADWLRMGRELETKFNVKSKEGILIQGDDQKNRDTTWWTGKAQKESSHYYWDRYEKYLKDLLPKEVVKTINTDTDIVMNNIENPKVAQFDRRGMVVGHVQSGKTGNYSALICKASDAGYKFIVVIAGGINNLRNQTQERLNESFVGVDKGMQVGVGIGNSAPDKLVVSLTTAERDFYKPDADKNSQGMNFDNIKTPVLLVIKKNTHTLGHVIKWLTSQYKNGVAEHAMLMIDDESDYASINTKEEEDPTTINKKLRELLLIFRKSAYVAYTATPYANIFIDHEASHEEHGEDLFPKDFIYTLDAPTNYFGARKIFLDSKREFLVPIDDYRDDIPPYHKKDFELPAIPKSLYEAMRVFILNVCIRHLRNQGEKHNSMLIHATRFTAVHQKMAVHVETYISDIKTDINSYGMLHDAADHSFLIKDIKKTYAKRYSNLKSEDKPAWLDVQRTLCKVMGENPIVVREVHQSTSIPLEYRKNSTTNAIVVGGASLSRGFTLEGLSVSYFLRNTVFYDTLMQMGRWFGYRSGYEDICRIYMPEAMISNFAQIIESTEDLIDDFKKMSNENMTPYDFGLAVKHHPDSGLQVTARNKQKSAEDVYFEMKLDGHAKETSCLSSKKETNVRNIGAIKHIVSKLYETGTLETFGNRSLWRDVKKDTIAEFLSEFEVFSLDPFGLRTRMPIDFIKKYVEEIDTLWDVALYSGVGGKYQVADSVFISKEERKVTDKGSHYELLNRQVSSGTAESIVLSKPERTAFGDKRKQIRAAMTKPLLMLHILETDEAPELAAFGISFPGGIKSKGKTVRLKINSVYIKKILEEEISDD